MDTELRNYNPGVTLVGQCAVCGKPVRDKDDPTPIYDRSDSDKPTGFIHGAFDCTDSYDCPVRRTVSADGGGLLVCLLPDAHHSFEMDSHPSGDHFWGELG